MRTALELLLLDLRAQERAPLGLLGPFPPISFSCSDLLHIRVHLEASLLGHNMQVKDWKQMTFVNGE